jgi:hypothetical protein
VPGDASPGSHGAAGSAPDPRVEGLVKVETRDDGPRVRDRLVASGAREVSGEGDDDDFDDLAEVAYRSGFRQAAGVQVSGERTR